MTAGERSAKSQEVIQRVLNELGHTACRTQLVKLVYFVDYIYFRHTGSTLTGLEYMWDDYGPNAISNAIVREAGAMVEAGQLKMTTRPTPYQDVFAFDYQTLPGSPNPALDVVAQAIIKDVVRKYGRYNVQKIAAASKRTEPFKAAHPGDVLRFERSELAPSPTEPHPPTTAEPQGAGAGKSTDELRRKFALV